MRMNPCHRPPGPAVLPRHGGPGLFRDPAEGSTNPLLEFLISPKPWPCGHRSGARLQVGFAPGKIKEHGALPSPPTCPWISGASGWVETERRGGRRGGVSHFLGFPCLGACCLLIATKATSDGPNTQRGLLPMFMHNSTITEYVPALGTDNPTAAEHSRPDANPSPAFPMSDHHHHGPAFPNNARHTLVMNTIVTGCQNGRQGLS